MYTPPPELKNAFAPETWDKLEGFLQEFVVFTSHERARLDICQLILAEKRATLKESMEISKPVTA